MLSANFPEDGLLGLWGLIVCMAQILTKLIRVGHKNIFGANQVISELSVTYSSIFLLQLLASSAGGCLQPHTLDLGGVALLHILVLSYSCSYCRGGS